MDYDNDTNEDYADISDEMIQEMKENSQLKSISLFKDYISHEPEFTGIHYISSYDILEILLNPKKCKKNGCISNYQLDLLKDLTMILFDKTYSENYYDTVCDNIFSKIYI